jgi:hypothetical protein
VIYLQHHDKDTVVVYDDNDWKYVEGYYCVVVAVFVLDLL